MTRAEAESLDELDDLSSDDLETDEALSEAENEPEFLPIPPSMLGLGGGRGSRPPRTALGQSYYRPRPIANFVTQTQLQSALTRVRNDVRANATGIKAVHRRIVGVEGRQAKNNLQQARQIAAVKNDLKKTKDMNLIMFLLTRPKTSHNVTSSEATVGGATIPAGSKLVYESGSGSTMLPLLLMFAMGGLGGDSGGDSGMNMLLPLMLLQPGLLG
jgi:hypothetical protein